MIQTIRGSATRVKWPLVLALLLSLVAGWGLFASAGLLQTRAGGDSPFLLIRTHQLVTALKDGQFPARWMGDAAYGMGYPFFNFYASLPYYLAALFKFIGFTYVGAIKAVQVFGLLGAATGAYLLSYRLWRSTWGAALASVAYTFTPFHLVNLYVRGDSLSEFYAFVFYPLVLLALLYAWEKPSPARASLVALAFGGLVMTHNVSALIFLPFAGLFLLYQMATAKDDRWRRLLWAGAGLVTGLALSAWFWLPALADQGLVHLEVQTTGYFSYEGHFRGATLVQNTLLFEYSADGPGTPFALGLVQAVALLAAAGWVIYGWARRRRVEAAEALTLVSLALAIWLITPSSRFLWDRIPLLPFAQFPWRFLSVAAFFGALLVGRLAEVRPRPRWTAEAAILIVALTAVVSLRPTYLYVSDADVTSERIVQYEAFTGNVGSTVRAEYLPDTTEPRPYAGESLWLDAVPGPRAVSGELLDVRLLEKLTAAQHWQVNVGSSEAHLAFQTLYYPGWRAYVDGAEVACEPQSGWGAIALSVPQGQHEVSLEYSAPRRTLAAEGVSALALVACILPVVTERKRLRRAARAVSLGALSLALLAVIGVASSGLSPAYSANDLTMDWAAGPYLGHHPGGLRFQNGPRLLDYTLSALSAKPGDEIRLSLSWSGPTDGLRVEATLESMAAPLFNVPDIVDRAAGSVQGSTATLALQVPDTVPPGAYLIGIRLLDGAAVVPAVDEHRKPIGQTYLQPIKVTGPAQLPEGSTLDFTFGDDVRLEYAQAESTGQGQLKASLGWVTQRQLSRNYAVSVRLAGPGDEVLAQHDSQPNYGFSPTTLWNPNEPVLDRHWLDLPPGLSPETDYRLQVVLYDPISLQPLGMATVPGVRLETFDVRESYPIVAQFGPGWALSSVSLGQTEAWQGERVPLHASWAATQSASEPHTVLVQLLDAQGKTVWESQMALNDGALPQNALLTLRHELQVPLQLAGGEYAVTLDVLDASGQSLGTYQLPNLLRVRERQRTFTLPDMQNGADVYFGEEIALLGYDVTKDGGMLQVELYWQAQAQPAADRTVFVHLLAADGSIITQWDAQPRAGKYPTSQWAPGEVVSDRVVLDVSGATPGSYRLAIGLYGPEGAGRLSARDANGNAVPDDRYVASAEIQLP